MGPGNLLLNTLKHILGEVESCIDAQGDTVEELQSKVFASTKHQHFIQKSSLLRYNQVTLISTLDKQTHVLESIPYDKNPFIGSNDKITHKWQSVLQTFQTFSYELSQDKQYLESLISTFETLVTHTTNQRINQLTVISVMLMPLTLITSLFGMNFLYMPLVVVPSGFWVVVLLMLISLLSSWLIFKLKKWV